MLELAFSFQGRLARLPYFLGLLAAGAAFVVVLLAIGLGAIVAATRHEWFTLMLLVVVILPLFVALLWCSLALHARRIRDIGWDPAIVIIGWILASAADQIMLVRLLPALVPGHGLHGTYVGILGNFAMSLLLLLLPGRKDDGDDVEAAPARPVLTAPVASSPRVATAGAPREFGRRGLG